MRQRTSQIDIDGVKYNEVFFPFADGYGYCDAIYKCDENGVYTCLWKKIDEKIIYPLIQSIIKTNRAWYPIIYKTASGGYGPHYRALSYKNDSLVTYTDQEGYFLTDFDGSGYAYNLWFCGGFLIYAELGIPIAYAVMTKDGKQMHDMHDIVINGSNSIGREVFKGNPYSSKDKQSAPYINIYYVLTDTEAMYQGGNGITYENEDEVKNLVYDANHRMTLVILWFDDGFLWIEETRDHYIKAHYTKNLISDDVVMMHINSVGYGTYSIRCIDYYYDKTNEKVYFLIAEFSVATFADSILKIVSYDGENLMEEADLAEYMVNPLYGGICKEGDYFFFWLTCNLYKTTDFTDIAAVDLGDIPSDITQKQVKEVVYDKDSDVYMCITSEYQADINRSRGYTYTFSNNFKNHEKEIIGIKVPQDSGDWY